MSEFGNVFGGECATEIVALIRQEAIDAGSPADYVAFLGSLYDRRKLADPFIACATWVEPIDKDVPSDPEMGIGAAFMRGSMLGLRVVEHYLGANNVQRVLTETKLAEPVVEDDDDGYKTKHMRGMLLCEVGEKGFAVAEMYRQVIEEWEDAITPDIRHQPYLRRGFGLVMNLMEQVLEIDATAVRTADLEAFASEVDALSDDWDTALLDEIFGS